jgi:hypothetical protein
MPSSLAKREDPCSSSTARHWWNLSSLLVVDVAVATFPPVPASASSNPSRASRIASRTDRIGAGRRTPDSDTNDESEDDDDDDMTDLTDS